MITLHQVIQQCARTPIHAAGLSASAYTAIWNALCEFVEQNLLEGKAVLIPNLGTFTFNVDKVDAGTLGVKVTRKPLFILAETFSSRYGTGAPRRPRTPGSIPTVRANPISIAVVAGKSKDIVVAAIDDILAYTGDYLHKSFAVTLDFKFCSLGMRFDKVQSKFKPEFLEKVKSLDSAKNPSPLKHSDASVYAHARRSTELMKEFGGSATPSRMMSSGGRPSSQGSPRTRMSPVSAAHSPTSPLRPLTPPTPKRTEPKPTSEGSLEGDIGKKTGASAGLMVQGISSPPSGPGTAPTSTTETTATTPSAIHSPKRSPSATKETKRAIKQHVRTVYRDAWRKQMEEQDRHRQQQKVADAELLKEAMSDAEKFEAEEREKKLRHREMERSVVEFNIRRLREEEMRRKALSGPREMGYIFGEREQSAPTTSGMKRESPEKIRSDLKKQIEIRRERERLDHERELAEVRAAIEEADQKMDKEKADFLRKRQAEIEKTRREVDEQIRHKPIGIPRFVPADDTLISTRLHGDDSKKERLERSVKIRDELKREAEERKLREKEQREKEALKEGQMAKKSLEELEEENRKKAMKKREAQESWRKEWDAQMAERKQLENAEKNLELESGMTSLDVGGDEHDQLVLKIARGEDPGKKQKDIKLKTIYGW